MEVLFVETSLFCVADVWIIFFLPVLASSRCSWQLLFWLVIGLCVSFLDMCTPCLLGILSEWFWIFSLLLHHCLCHHFMLLTSCFLQRPICVAFCELCPSWLSLLSEYSHSFLFKLVWSQRVRITVNSFAFPSHMELCIINTVFSLYFLFQKTCFTLLIEVRLFGETFTDRWGPFCLLVNKLLTLIVICYDFCTFLGCYLWAISRLPMSRKFLNYRALVSWSNYQKSWPHSSFSSCLLSKASPSLCVICIPYLLCSSGCLLSIQL